MSATQTNALLEILAAIVEAVTAAGPLGCPGGVLFAALMCHGCTLDQFQSIMSVLVKTGRLEKRGECYYVTGKGGE